MLNKINVKPKLITFDIYSALVDIYNGLTPLISDVTGLPSQNSHIFLKNWRYKQLQTTYLSNSLNIGRFSFYKCTEMSLDYVCKINKLRIKAGDKKTLISYWNKLPLWPEAFNVISSIISRGYKIAILSNGDQEMLEKLSKSFGFKFDYIFSSESNGFYKPHSSIYELPKIQLGINKSDILHVAGSDVDVIGTVSYGMECLWSNRKGEILIDKKFKPKYESQNLSVLEKILL
tara:strand:- start:1020 stop:1715 length:696 start_codon:yes stop_codon:yes gene_type:complete